MNEWKAQTIEDLCSKLETSQDGLTSIEAVKRLKQFGNNILSEKKPESVFSITIRQFVSPFVLVLVVATVIMLFLREYVDAGVIGIVLLVNTIIGVIQEGKAQNTLLALKKFTKTKTLVLRDGQEIKINSIHTVPGDVLILRAGDKVSADARITEAQGLRINESALTGESDLVSKDVHCADNKEDNLGVIFKGTYITAGSGRAIVTTTGQQTVIGSISRRLETLDSEVPLKKNIRQLSKIVTVVTIIASVSILAFGTFAGYPFKDMFFLAVAVAVSVIPEGLPVVITLVLALGVYRMGNRNALVKRMQAVEALGQVDVVAVDKTGTITHNELMVKEIVTGMEIKTVDGQGYEKIGKVYIDGNPINPVDHAGLVLATRVGVLASDASIYKREDGNIWEVIGDPTEAALIVLGQKIGIDKEALVGEIELLHEIPFKSELQYHATLYREKNKNIIYVVGAPEVLIASSTKIWKDGRSVAINQGDKDYLTEQISRMSKKGQRVLVSAMKNTKKISVTKDDIEGMTFVGLLGMQDSIRDGVRDSVAVAKRSGIQIVMITGDYKGTAVAIARQAGIFSEGDKVLTGQDIATFSEETLAEHLDGVTVFARVSPEQKLAIVNAYKISGKKVAMTGDGVNDALSLVSADLGISMGLSGTEVAKEASDIILLDDDIKSIIAAVEEGRSIYATIRRVILYLFSTNLSELLVIVFALMFFFQLPLQPSQILWLNLITDGFLVLAFVFDKKITNDTLDPKTKGTFVINRLMFIRMFIMASVMTLGTLLMFLFFYEESLIKGWTIAMTTLAFFQWFNVWNVRSRTQTVFQKSTLSNPYLIVAAIFVVLLQLFAVYSPSMNTFLKTTPLSVYELALVIAVSSSVIFVEEVRKLIKRLYV